MSDGMIRNAALAVLAACELGVSVQEISERLPLFRPSALRDKCFQRPRTILFYCYNANPSSMFDSIKYFTDQFQDRKKLFVLAGMEELGSDEKKFHVDLGSEILIGENDLVILIGEKAAWFAEGLITTGCRDNQIIVLGEIEDAISIVEDFEGAILLREADLTNWKNYFLVGQLIMNWRMKQNAELSSAGRRIFWSSQIVSIYLSACNSRWYNRITFWLFSWAKINQSFKRFRAKQAFRDRDEVGELANLHEGKAKTPTMGGFLIFGSVIFSTLLWADPNIYVITAMLVYVVLTVVGFLDDFPENFKEEQQKGLAGRYKLIGQLIATGLALFLLLGPLGDILTGVHGRALGSTDKMMELWVPFYSDVLILSMPLVLVIGLFLLTLTGSSNAINLTDGLDGLAIGAPSQ